MTCIIFLQPTMGILSCITYHGSGTNVLRTYRSCPSLCYRLPCAGHSHRLFLSISISMPHCFPVRCARLTNPALCVAWHALPIPPAHFHCNSRVTDCFFQLSVHRISENVYELVSLQRVEKSRILHVVIYIQPQCHAPCACIQIFIVVPRSVVAGLSWQSLEL